MSVSYIPTKTKALLWGKASGRCQFAGCNKLLYIDELTKSEFNQSYIAHIIADKPTGPRGHPVLSERLKSDISNLMLLCDAHHRLIDVEDVKGHPTDLLQSMKREHEDRILLLTSIQVDRKSHVLLYGATIGTQHPHVNWQKAAEAMVPNYFPAEYHAIELSLKNSSYNDDEPQYWKIEKEHLHRQFQTKVLPRFANGDINHLSIFALAPQPLLIELGRLISDIQAAEVYQLHREPPNWIWQHDKSYEDFVISAPGNIHKTVALKLELSASISDKRVQSVLGLQCSIWSMAIPKPHNDFLQSREQLSLFRQQFRRLLNEIKKNHGEDAIIHIFPAMPVSVAIEIGRTWMPKADLPFKIYDQNRKLGGFIPAL